MPRYAYTITGLLAKIFLAPDSHPIADIGCIAKRVMVSRQMGPGYLVAFEDTNREWRGSVEAPISRIKSENLRVRNVRFFPWRRSIALTPPRTRTGSYLRALPYPR